MFACCDESAGKRWWIYGAVWLPSEARLPRYESDATELRQRTNCWGEFKWEKAGLKYLDPYEEFLALTFDLPSLKFTSIVIDTKLFTPGDMKKYHGEGGEHVAYLKFMRLLLRERMRRFAKRENAAFVILYDKLSMPRRRVSEFRNILIGDVDKITYEKGFAVSVDHLSQANSASLHLLQAADMLTSATCWAWEGQKGSGDSAKARRALLRRIEAWAGNELTYTGYPGGRYYSAWKWEPS